MVVFGFSKHGFIPLVYPRFPSAYGFRGVAVLPGAIGEELFTEPRPSPTAHQLTGSEIFKYPDTLICFSVVCLGKLYVRVDDELETRFRVAVLRIKGKKRGVLSKAVEEAIRLWLEKYESQG
ncbi:MAG: hypothetical protein QW224_03000 [Desulfurococcaceae archaeon]